MTVTSPKLCRMTLVMILLVTLAGCIGSSNSITSEPEPETITLYVASYRQDCVGVAPQKCLLVKATPSENWSLFYDTIEGFEYIEGVEYELLVTREDVLNPPADASSFRYQLLQIVNQVQVALDLEMTAWELESYRQTDDSLAEVIEGTSVTAKFEDGRVHGSAGCNSYFASYELTDDSLSIGMAGATKMYCHQEGVMQQEQSYLSLLQSVQNYRIQGQRLELSDADGTTLLNFRGQRQPADE